MTCDFKFMTCDLYYMTSDLERMTLTHRERDLVAVQEAQQHQQAEKDQQYNALVKSLKDRVRAKTQSLRKIREKWLQPKCCSIQLQCIAFPI